MIQTLLIGLNLATGLLVTEPANSTRAQTPIRNLQNAQTVTVSGRIVGWEDVEDNEFILEDETGRILVDADSRRWRNLNLSIGDIVTVSGEIDDGELDAFSIVVNEPANSTRAQTPIRSLQNAQTIAVSGRIVGWGEADENEFILEDETGRILVDAGPRWWRDLNLSIGDTVTVSGEIDDGELDAFSLTLANGETIQIRPAQGPPPWAGRDD